MTLPNFIVIGAAKSGTTSVYEYLRQHPQVFMSPLKETNFFAFNEEKPRFRGPFGRKFNTVEAVFKYEDYCALFNGVTSEIAIGEVSPRYMRTPGTAERIKKRIPNAGIIVILRNPADRAFSDFSMFKLIGCEPCDTLAEAITDEPRRIRERWAYCTYLRNGYYGRQLKEYYSWFGRNQILVYLYEDLLQNPVRLLQGIFRSIGVDDNFVPNMSKSHNVSGNIKNPVLRFVWRSSFPIRSLIGPVFPKNVRQGVSGLFTSREKVKLDFPEGTRRQLVNLYREDILKLQQLIQRDLSMWLQ